MAKDSKKPITIHLTDENEDWLPSRKRNRKDKKEKGKAKKADSLDRGDNRGLGHGVV